MACWAHASEVAIERVVLFLVKHTAHADDMCVRLQARRRLFRVRFRFDRHTALQFHAGDTVLTSINSPQGVRLHEARLPSFAVMLALLAMLF
jgi:hypothetical protein